jgi:hypothetical protein
VESSSTVAAVAKDRFELLEQPTIAATIKAAVVIRYGMRIKSEDA